MSQRFVVHMPSMGRYFHWLAVGSLAVLTSGCADPDSGDLYEIGIATQEIGLEGRWTIPDEVLALGDTQFVEYTGAGPWSEDGSSCAGGMTFGASVFRDYLYQYFPQVSLVGGYNCRHINGKPEEASVHSTGRALDIHIPRTIDVDADNSLGDPLAHWLIRNSEKIGVSIVIWDKTSWGPHRDVGEKERPYDLTPHDDHLHIELSLEAAEAMTPWFQQEWSAPNIAECESIPPSGIVFDETHPCVQIMGPSQYWRRETGVGFGNGLVWTDAYTADSHANSVRWNFNLEEAGRYQVAVYLEPEFAVHARANYKLFHRGEVTELAVDQSAADGWHALGVFEFAEGNDQYLSLFDNNVEDIGIDQHIAADAIRLIRIEDPAEVTPGDLPKSDEILTDSVEMDDDNSAGCRVASDSEGTGGLLLILGALFWRRKRLVVK